MKLQDKRKTVRIYFNRKDKINGKPAYDFLMQSFLDMQVSGCTVYRSLASYGQNFRIRSGKGPAFLKNKGLVLEVIETEKKSQEILRFLDVHLKNGLVSVQDINMIRYSGTFPSDEDQELADTANPGEVGDFSD